MRRFLSFLLTAALLLSLLPASLAAEPEEAPFTTQPKIDSDMALLSNGTVYVWGSNDPANVNSRYPVLLDGLERIVDIAPGMALDADGHVWTWGANDKGQLGDGTTTTRGTPAMVEGLEDVVAISSCLTNKAAVTSDGALYIWGGNKSGQLGLTNDNNPHPSPVKIERLNSVRSVALGYLSYETYVLALLTDGTVWALGSNRFGGLGGGQNPYQVAIEPLQIEGLENITAVLSGGGSCFALCGDGTVWSWGHNSDGQLGYTKNISVTSGASSSSYKPQKMVGLTDITTLACGSDYTLALDKDGALWACGLNYYGDFGNKPPLYNSNGISPAIHIDDVSQPAVGVAIGSRSILLMEDGTIQSPGGSSSDIPDYFRPMEYEDGLPFYADRYPLRITAQPGGNTTGLSTGLYQAGEELTVYAVPELGSSWAGWSGEGLALAEPQDTVQSFTMPNGPASLTAQFQLTDCLSVTPDLAGSYATVTALRSDGTVWTWGNNLYGQLGNGGPEESGEEFRPAAATVPGSSGAPLKATAMAAGGMHTLVIGERNSAWGDNSAGQLGNGKTENAAEPAYVSGLYGSVLAAGECFSMSLYHDPNGKSSIYYWGLDIINGMESVLTPTKLTIPDTSYPATHYIPTNIIDIAAGGTAALLLCRDGTVWTVGWGSSTEDRLPRQVEELEHISAISVGSGYFLALGQDGTVWTWGSGLVGQSSDVPVKVPGLSNVTAISAGYSHAAAIDAEGNLWTWGVNTSGQLGDGTTEDRSVPVKVRQSVSFVRAGNSQTFAADQDGYLYACGYNGNGELGCGTYRDTSEFVPVVEQDSDQPFSLLVYPLELGTAVGGGGASRTGQTYFPKGAQVTVDALPNVGSIFQAWSAEGVELADPQANPAVFTMPDNKVVLTPSFTSEEGSIPQVAIAAGSIHALALNDGGTVYGWGSNNYKQLGDRYGYADCVPGRVPLLQNVADVVCSYYASIFLMRDGTVWYAGQIATGLSNYTLTPIERLTDITAIAAGDNHLLALDKDGVVWGFGFDRDGCLATAAGTVLTQPVQIAGLPTVTAIWAGPNGSAAKAADGSVYVWGYDDYFGRFGTLESGTSDTSLTTPTKLDWPCGKIRSFAIGDYFCAALAEDGTVWACGRNWEGQLGNGTENRGSEVPVQVSGLENITAISTRSMHIVALDSSGTLWGWGRNMYGQLGNGTRTDSSVPVKMAEDVLLAEAGDDFTLIVKEDYSVLACGSNSDKQLGYTTSSNYCAGFKSVQCNERDYTLYARSVTIQAGTGGKITARGSSSSDWLQGSKEPATEAISFFAPGEYITVNAVPDRNWLFDHWSCEGVNLAYPSNSSVAFTLPDCAVTLTAHFKVSPIQVPEEPGGPFPGEVGDPDLTATPIDSPDALARIGTDPDYPLDGSYALTADLDLSGYTNWTPIGTESAPFTGTFDGCGRVIRGLTITSPAGSYAGLFGVTYGADIKNVGLEQVSLSFAASGTINAGAVAGRLDGGTTLSNCYVTGSLFVVGSSYSSMQLHVGGLAGYAAASLTDCSNRASIYVCDAPTICIGGVAGYVESGSYTLTRCSNDGEITTDDTTTNAYCGGVFGRLSSGLTVSQCRNLAQVEGMLYYGRTGGTFVLGGIAGASDSSLSNCYNQGDVVGGELECYQCYAGGIVGQFYRSGTTIQSCYNSGDVSAGACNAAYAGGIAGHCNYSGSIKNCLVACRYVDSYYNYFVGSQGGVAFNSYAVAYRYNNASGNRYLTGVANRGYGISVSTSGATSLTSAALASADTYTAMGWDLTGVWELNQQSGDLPWFVWEAKAPISILCYDRAAVTLQVSEDMGPVLLCAASYDGGKLMERRSVFLTPEEGRVTYSLPINTAKHIKVFLLDPDTLEPLCYPWSK